METAPLPRFHQPKKGKTTADNLATSPPLHETPDPSTNAGSFIPPTLTPPNQTHAPSVQTLIEALTLQLETLSRSVSALLAQYPDTAGLNTSCTQQALQALSNALPVNTQYETPTMSNPPSLPGPRPMLPQPLRTANPTIEHARTQPGMARSQQPMRPAESKRLIVDFFGGNHKDLPPYQVRDYVNKFLDEQGLGFKTTAAKCTKSRNVALTVILPCAANTLLQPRY